MILIVGGTGNLGRHIVRVLTERGQHVRVLTRNPGHARTVESQLVEVILGDVRNQADVDRAMTGAHTVISAMHGFTGTGTDNPKTIDHLGNRTLIEAAMRHGARHFVLISVHGAAADHPMELFRMKHLAEEELTTSGLTWTIIRPTAYMETWAKIVGEPLVTGGKTRIFGSGRNPINFVSVTDVSQVVERAIVDQSLTDEVVEIGGPENLTMRQFVDVFSEVTGKAGKVGSVPLPMMRVMSVLMRQFNPTLARQAQAGIMMDTTDQTFDPREVERRYPWLKRTSLADVVRREYGRSEAPVPTMSR